MGIEVSSYPDGYRLSQHYYTLDLLARSGLTDTRTAATPMELHLQLHASDRTPLSDPSRYRHLVDSLVYLTITRLDISHAVHILGQFVDAPTSVHYAHLLRACFLALPWLCGGPRSRPLLPAPALRPRFCTCVDCSGGDLASLDATGL